MKMPSVSASRSSPVCKPRRTGSLAPEAVLAVVLAAGALAAGVEAQESQFRSPAERRQSLRDERQLPRKRERSTHRGYEVATGQIVVLSATSLEDARDAAQQAEEAWTEISALADHFTSVHRQANFGQGTVQIVIDREPQAGAEEGPRIIRAEQATQVIVSMAPGESLLEDQAVALRTATTRAFLRTAELDQQLPDWVCQGLAGYAGGQRPEPIGNPAQRDASDDPHADAVRLVTFLMEGNDARHAAPFFQHLREHLATWQPDEHRHARRQTVSRHKDAPTSERLDTFVSQLSQELADWEQDRDLGQPQVAGEETTDQGLKQVQQEMLFALKLANRFAQAESPTVRTRITSFQGGRATSELAVPNASRPLSLSNLLAQITQASDQPWAIVGPDGKLLWSTDREGLAAAMGIGECRYQPVWDQDRWKLQRELADGTKLVGWLEPNPENPRRPLAKFSASAAR